MAKGDVYGHLLFCPGIWSEPDAGIVCPAECIYGQNIWNRRFVMDEEDGHMWSELEQKALKIAWQAHKGQTDKAGQPYIYHVLAVSKAMGQEKCRVLALLHDVCEDSDLTRDDLIRRGIPEDIAHSVQVMTRKKGEDYMDYIRRVSLDDMARSVKIQDLKHNMDLTRIPNPTGKDWTRVEKYEKALRFLLTLPWNL